MEKQDNQQNYMIRHGRDFLIILIGIVLVFFLILYPNTFFNILNIESSRNTPQQLIVNSYTIISAFLISRGILNLIENISAIVKWPTIFTLTGIIAWYVLTYELFPNAPWSVYWR